MKRGESIPSGLRRKRKCLAAWCQSCNKSEKRDESYIFVRWTRTFELSKSGLFFLKKSTSGKGTSTAFIGVFFVFRL